MKNSKRGLVGSAALVILVVRLTNQQARLGSGQD